MTIKELRELISEYSEDTVILFEDYSDIQITEYDGDVFITTIYGKD